MSADRTLMSVIRTSLALISFGFTIFQFFQRLREENAMTSSRGARNFGTSLVLLGVVMLLIGIVYHLQFMISLRQERKHLTDEHLIHGESRFPTSLTLIIACILFLIGVTAVMNMVFHFGPFS